MAFGIPRHISHNKLRIAIDRVKNLLIKFQNSGIFHRALVRDSLLPLLTFNDTRGACFEKVVIKTIEEDFVIPRHALPRDQTKEFRNNSRSAVGAHSFHEERQSISNQFTGTRWTESESLLSSSSWQTIDRPRGGRCLFWT